jgi:protein disulfide-isomerase A6
VSYEGGRAQEDFLQYINENAGTFRLPGGGLNILAGTVDVLDKLVAKFTGGAKLADVAAEIKKEAAGIQDKTQLKYAEYYVRVFDKLNKSDGYVAKELARLDGILEKGGLAPAKRDEIQRKTNVLRKFTEKIEEIKDEL